MISQFKISIIIPALDEEKNIQAIIDRLAKALKDVNYELIFVDDGSQDGTLAALKHLRSIDPKVHFLSFSRNFGHQNALKAGLDHADGDAQVFMDCDLQHPPELLPEMLRLWLAGNEIVYTVRKNNPQLPFLKRLTSSVFYRIINLLSDVPIVEGRADFFLIDKKVVNILRNYDESPLFFRGILPWVGFKQACLHYTPGQRLNGQTKYSLKKMLEFAIDGITSFSIKPLRASIYCGSFLSMGAFIYLGFVIYIKIFTNLAVSGWASVLASVLLLSGIQLLMLGIIGEYLGKLFINAKKRPPYIVQEKSL